MESRERSDSGGDTAGNQGSRRYKVNDDSGLNPADIGLKDAGACAGACFDQFTDEWYKKTGGTFADVCKQLSHEPNTELWKLYCCDSIYCGVWAPEKGNNPGVDSIINRCLNTGNYVIYDPGPPPKDFDCKSVANTSEPGTLGQHTTSPSNSPSATTTIASISSPLATETLPSSDLNSTLSGAGVVPSPPTGLTEGSKAAIGICASLAIIAIIFLVGFLISRRRSPPQSYFDDAPNAPHHHGRSFSEPPSGSRTPLITPPPSASSKGPPLTPPLRLSDRRFLPSLLKQGGTTNSSLASGIDERTYPHAAFGLPLEKTVTRHERRATTSSIHNTPCSPSTPAAVHFAPQFLRDSVSSYGSGPGGASTATIESNKASSIRFGAVGASPLLQPLSPTRPPRSHDGLDIPHLTTPAGPPPNRALPAPPPYHPSSPTFTVSPISPSTSPMPPSIRPLALGESKGPVESSATLTPSPTYTKEPSNLADSYARGTSESWGSWSGTGAGGGPGASVVGGKKRGYGGNSSSLDEIGDRGKQGMSGSTVSLKELDLEKLGDKY